jgi:microcystin-dependent protein
MYNVYIILFLVCLVIIYLSDCKENFAETTVSYTDSEKAKFLQILKDNYEIDALLNISQIAKGLLMDGYTIPGNLNVVNKLNGKQIYQDNYLLIPTGTVFGFGGGIIPTGYLVCDGSNVSRTTYADLFKAIGTVFGNGDGSTTFGLPDLKGKVVVGAGAGPGLTNRVLGVTGGSETHTLTLEQMPSHNHDINDPGHNHTTQFEYSKYNQVCDKTKTGGRGSDCSANGVNSNRTGITINNRGGGQPHNNMQPFLVMNYIIKY